MPNKPVYINIVVHISTNKKRTIKNALLDLCYTFKMNVPQKITMKYLSLLITTIIFSALCYLVFSFAHWSFNITEWSAVARLLWLFTLVVPAYNHSKKFIKL